MENISEEVIKVLKEKLRIKIKKRFNEIKVEILIDNDIISESEIYFNDLNDIKNDL